MISTIAAACDDAVAVATSRIETQRLVFDQLEQAAVLCAQAGDDHGAVRAAAVAARYAHGSHTGRFASVGLETILSDIGRRQVGGGRGRTPRGGVAHVLHVLTETYAIGGHTRLARRWIDLDNRRRHSVFVTGVMNGVTAWLADAAIGSGGAVMMCGGNEPAIDRARALRTIARDVDLVVVHAHPFDAAPALAFAEPEGRPPVVFMNHADHAFWLGVAVADGVADFRPAGSRVTEQLRGVPRERCHMIALPLERELPSTDRRAARARLRMDERRPLMASVGAAYKYGAALEPAFPDLVAGALRETPDAMLVAVGPTMDERWRTASEACGGRLVPVGFNPDAGTLLQAADVYVDSWPCSSATAVLEAGLYGVPIVTFRPDPATPGHLAPDMPSLDDHMIVCSNPRDHATAIAELLGNPAHRAVLGAAMRDRIHEQHAGASWHDALERLVAAVTTAGPAAVPMSVPPRPPAQWETTIDTLHALAGIGISADDAVEQETLLRRYPPGAVELARVVASPELEPAVVAAVVDAFRDLVACGRASSCVVAVREEEKEDAIPLLEAALAAGRDVDVDLVAVSELRAFVEPTDICVAEAGSAMADACAAAGALARLVTV